MITGLQVDVLAQELIDHLREEAAEHRDKAQHCARRLASLKALPLTEAEGMDPTATLTRTHDQRLARAVFYQFLADHVVTGETYRLTVRDLRDIGLAESAFEW
jgi:hypothetical protein